MSSIRLIGCVGEVSIASLMFLSGSVLGLSYSALAFLVITLFMGIVPCTLCNSGKQE